MKIKVLIASLFISLKLVAHADVMCSYVKLAENGRSKHVYSFSVPDNQCCWTGTVSGPMQDDYYVLDMEGHWQLQCSSFINGKAVENMVSKTLRLQSLKMNLLKISLLLISLVVWVPFFYKKLEKTFDP